MLIAQNIALKIWRNPHRAHWGLLVGRNPPVGNWWNRVFMGCSTKKKKIQYTKMWFLASCYAIRVLLGCC